MELKFTLNEIDSVAAEILKKAGHRKCLAFFAPMGAGKTTLINALCKQLQVVDNVSSPTYSIINEYKSADDSKVIHMDWYRLKDENDALNAGVGDYLSEDVYCFVEWPERAERLLPADYLRIELEVLDVEQRRCIIS